MKRKLFKISLIFFIFLIIFAVILCIMMKHADKKYWESQVRYKISDGDYLEVSDFKPNSYKVKDNELCNEIYMFLEQSLNHTDYEKLETKLIISSDFYNILVPDINETANSISDFLVVEHNNKMVVTFHYQNSKEKIDIKSAEDNCLKSYKTYPYDKMYLELINDKWTVVDLYRHA